MTDGAIVRIAEGAKLAKPLLLVFARAGGEARLVTTATSSALQPAPAPPSSRRTSRWRAPRRGQANALSEVVGRRGRNAAPTSRSCSTGSAATHLATWLATLGKGATYRAFQLTAGTGLARNNITVTFAGEGAKLDISGAVPGRGAEHIDTTLVVDHAVPGCESRELFKGVLDDRARGVFQGKVIVRPRCAEDRRQADGAGADAVAGRGVRLQARARDLRRRRRLRPRLDLRRDRRGPDVLLRSRGIPPDEARALLIESFVGEAIDKIEDEGVREAFSSLATRRLGRAVRRARLGAARAAEDDMTAMTKETDITGEPRLRRRAHPRRFPDPVPRGLRQAARLSRQRRLGAEAALGARRHRSRLQDRVRQRPSRPALPLQRRDRQVRGRARDRAPLPQRADASRRSSSPATLTEAINLVASSFGADFKEGDEIVLSIMEHHSNIVPWHFLRERKGCVLKWAPISDNGEFLTRRVRGAAEPSARGSSPSRTCRTCWAPSCRSRRWCGIAHARGIPVLVDGAQAAVHMPVDVQDLDCDFYAFTGHKAYGPTGIGVLYAKRKHLDAMQPYQGGGDMIESVHTDRITYGKPPHKFEAGTPPIVQAIGLGAALELHDAGGARPHRRARGGAQGLRARAARRAQLAEDPRPAPGQGRHRLVQRSTACTRTTSRPSSTARAWRCAPATTARSR